jgi:hypothetical protein
MLVLYVTNCTKYWLLSFIACSWDRDWNPSSVHASARHSYFGIFFLYIPLIDTIAYNCMWQSFLEKLLLLLIVKFPAFYGTRNFVTIFTESPPLAPILSHMIPILIPVSFYKIAFNIWQGLQIMKFPIMRFSPNSCSFFY